MRPDRLFVLMLVICGLFAATSIAAMQFKPTEIDKSATYAVRLTLADDNTWKERETFKLCKLPNPAKDRRGETISYAVVAVTRDCPH